MKAARPVLTWFVAAPLLIHWSIAGVCIAAVASNQQSFASGVGLGFVMALGAAVVIALIVPLLLLYTLATYQLSTAKKELGAKKLMALGVAIPVPFLTTICMLLPVSNIGG